MKKMIRVIISFGVLFILSSSILISAESLEVLSENKIPDAMLPYTIIEYGENNEITIIEGGFSELSFVLTNDYQVAPGTIFIDNPPPSEGMRVEYDGEGLLKNIFNKDSSEVFKIPHSMPGLKTNYEYRYEWGASQNILTTRKTNGRWYCNGSGRFTIFTDTIGNYSNTLKKGDCAVRMGIMNPPSNTAINCYANGRNATLYKNDVGGMPDAVLDVWKTGVEYFGGSVSSYWSATGTISYNYAA